MKISFYSIIAILLFFTLGSLLWEYGFCRFYVPPEHIAVLTAQEGKPLEQGQILAKPGQKGLLEDTLGPGRHFRNPYTYKWEIIKAKNIPPGKIGIVTAKVGKTLPAGKFLANKGEKGIWKYPLGPGLHAINPYGYDVEIIDALSIPIGYIGVVTSLSGSPAAPESFAKEGETGVMGNILQPGLYYINPKAYRVDLIEIGINQISLSGKGINKVVTKNAMITENKAMEGLQNRTLATQQAKRADYLEESRNSSLSSLSSLNSSDPPTTKMALANAPQTETALAKTKEKKSEKQKSGEIDSEFTLDQHVEFPSRDGFKILLDMTVEFELLPDKVASVYRDYGDMPAVVDKILMPQILSVSRLKGSAYKGTDFIVGEGREKFQIDLTKDLQDTLKTKNIAIHEALIRSVNVPTSILVPLQQASIAVEQNQTNIEQQKTEKKQAELNTETQIIEQRRQEVEQETKKMRAEIEASKRKEVAEIGAEMTRKIAVLEKETAQKIAEKDIVIGKATADAILLTEGEQAKGLALNINAMGSANAYTMSEFANGINPKMKIQIRHSGVGTLWTDGNFSKGEAALLQKK